jgi:U3 small nucleolar RNA-associated protein 4
MAAEPIIEYPRSHKASNGSIGIQYGVHDDSDTSSDESDDDDGRQLVRDLAEQRVAVGCDDGCLRLFAVDESEDGMVYRRTFPRLEGWWHEVSPKTFASLPSHSSREDFSLCAYFYRIGLVSYL